MKSYLPDPQRNALSIPLGFILMLVFFSYSCQGKSQHSKGAPESASATEQDTSSQEPEYPIQKSENEWKAALTDAEFYVLRKAGTELAFTSPLLEEKREGVFHCAGCGTPVYSSEHKYESYSGWPSFDRPIEGNVAYDVDYKIGYKRTEVHCASCGGHLGHIFADGPAKTTGMRHCINGVALDFVPSGN